jgi:hypothetical protein
MKTLRIMTTVHLANHGGCLFADSLYRTLTRSLPDYDVRTLDYIPRNWYYHELARAFKGHPKALTFNLRRFWISEKFHRQYLNLEKPTSFYPVGYEGMVNFLAEKPYDALVVGMVIWDITDLPQFPRFPNIYWLSERIPSTKIAYAASGHRSQLPLIQKNLPTIQKILSSYALIGVRDRITWEMVLESKVDQVVPVSRVPDPTFLLEDQPSEIRDIFESHGIDINRPILGVLLYGKPALSERLCNYYRSKGYQTVALSMYNPFADTNLGHLLTPYDWADAFKYLSFCVTDRYHGTIFCLRNNLPFISIEPYEPRTAKNSKIYSLLNDFDMLDCYYDVLQPEFNIDGFLERAGGLQSEWERIFQPRVAEKLSEMKTLSQDFIGQVRAIL